MIQISKLPSRARAIWFHWSHFPGLPSLPKTDILAPQSSDFHTTVIKNHALALQGAIAAPVPPT